MKKLILFFALFFAFNANATVIEWDHDCSDADGFYVYRFDDFDDNPSRSTSINCPTTQATVFVPGWYSVTAYNEHGESTKSNDIELAQYYYNNIKIEYDPTSGLVLYRGEHTSLNAATDDPNWVIKRFYYDASERLIEIKIQITSWDNRTSGW